MPPGPRPVPGPEQKYNKWPPTRVGPQSDTNRSTSANRQVDYMAAARKKLQQQRNSLPNKIMDAPAKAAVNVGKKAWKFLDYVSGA